MRNNKRLDRLSSISLSLRRWLYAGAFRFQMKETGLKVCIPLFLQLPY